MTVILIAPHELPQTAIQLPSPKLNDTHNVSDDVIVRNSMNGVLYSYVKSNNRLEINWDFNVSKEKAIELEEFIKVYSSYNFRLIDWRSRVFKVKLINLPLVFSSASLNERQNVRLQFEGERLV